MGITQAVAMPMNILQRSDIHNTPLATDTALLDPTIRIQAYSRQQTSRCTPAYTQCPTSKPPNAAGSDSIIWEVTQDSSRNFILPQGISTATLGFHALQGSRCRCDSGKASQGSDGALQKSAMHQGTDVRCWGIPDLPLRHSLRPRFARRAPETEKTL